MKDMNEKKSFLMINPVESLYSSVISRIYVEKKNQAKKRLVYNILTVFMSFLALIPTSIAMIDKLSTSGFYNYFSLIFSDGFTILSYWKELSLSLIESFSLPEFIIILSLSFILLLSGRVIIKNIKIFYAPIQFI